MEQAIDAAEVTLDQAIRTRRSIRAFLDKPVPEDVLHKIFEMAQQAPSNCNVQPWKVLVASGAARDRIRQKLVDAVMGGVESDTDYHYSSKFEGDYRRRQVDCAVAMYDKMGIGRDDHAGRGRAMLRNFELFDAPHVAFLCMLKGFKEPVAVDMGIYLQTLMLAMTAHGVSSCAQGSMRTYPGIVREEFPGNDDYCVLVGLSFGYEDPGDAVNETRTSREDVSACVTFNSE